MLLIWYLSLFSPKGILFCCFIIALLNTFGLSPVIVVLLSYPTYLLYIYGSELGAVLRSFLFENYRSLSLFDGLLEAFLIFFPISSIFIFSSTSDWWNESSWFIMSLASVDRPFSCFFSLLLFAVEVCLVFLPSAECCLCDYIGFVSVRWALCDWFFGRTLGDEVICWGLCFC